MGVKKKGLIAKRTVSIGLAGQAFAGDCSRHRHAGMAITDTSSTAASQVARLQLARSKRAPKAFAPIDGGQGISATLERNAMKKELKMKSGSEYFGNAIRKTEEMRHKGLKHTVCQVTREAGKCL
mgnify:CR=1 FL=1